MTGTENLFGRPYALEAGRSVADCRDFDEVVAKAHLDFMVEKRRIKDAEDGQVIKGIRHLRRTDTKETFATVKEGYQVVQNRKALAFARELHERNFIDFDRAGIIDGGAKVWISATLRNRKIIGAGSNEMITNLIFIAGHDTSTGVKISFTACRVFCLNMIVGRHANLFNYTVKHTKNVEARLNEIKKVMSQSMEAYDLLEKEMDELVAARVSGNQFEQYVESFFPGKENRYSTKSENQMAIIHDFYRKDPSTGTAWGAYNSVAQWVDHERGYSRPDRRMFMNLFGEGARIKIRAFERAMRI